MKIYPAIDIREGHVVRLKQGRFEDMTVYDSDPCEVARTFEAQGASLLHVVDLDAAKAGRPVQLPILERLALQSNLKIQAGGGIRTLDDAQRLIDYGVDRIIVGSLAAMHPDIFRQMLHRFGPKRVTLGLDLRRDDDDGTYCVALHGWQERSRLKASDLLDLFLADGLEQVLCTDISKDGLLEGPNHELYQYLTHAYPQICFLASGGVRDVEDLRRLQKEGAGGAIIGRALYEGRIRLGEALQC